MKNGVLRDFAKFTGKQLCQSLFSRLATLLKKEIQDNIVNSYKQISL